MRKYLWLYTNAMGSDNWGITTSKEEAIDRAKEMLSVEATPGFGDGEWTWEFHKAPRRMSQNEHLVVLATTRNQYTIEHQATVRRMHVRRETEKQWLLYDPTERSTYYVNKRDVDSPGMAYQDSLRLA